MILTVAEQIQERFREIQDVKHARVAAVSALSFRNHAPDVIVETWMNSRLYVYILDCAPKPRDIRSILKQNTGSSIGTLFLVKSALLPGDGHCGKLADWQRDLRALQLGAVQAFDCGADGLRLVQVNMDETPQPGQFVVWYSRALPFDAVAVRRRDVTTGVRGSWVLGDICSPQFKRSINEERARQRFHYRSHYGQALQDPHAAEDTNAAYLVLEIEVGAGQAAVKQAFRKLARQYHPDVSVHEKAEAKRRFQELQSAYERIKSQRRWT